MWVLFPAHEDFSNQDRGFGMTVDKAQIWDWLESYLVLMVLCLAFKYSGFCNSVRQRTCMNKDLTAQNRGDPGIHKLYFSRHRLDFFSRRAIYSDRIRVFATQRTFRCQVHRR
jgi:hypothetical protein